MLNGKETIVCSSTRRRIDLSVVNEKGKGTGKESDKEKVMVAIVIIANHRPRNTSGKLLPPETSRNTHLEAMETLSKWDNQQFPWKAFLRSDGILPSEKIRKNFSHQSLERAKVSDKFPSLSVIQTDGKTGDLQMHHRTTQGPQSGMRREFSRQMKHTTNFTKSSSRQKDTTHMSREQASSEVTPLQKLRLSLTVWRYIPKKGRTKSTGASLHMMGLHSLNNDEHNIIRQSGNILEARVYI